MKYKYIDNTANLEHICENILSKSDVLAVDTEFIRQNTYWPILCLIQIATRDQIFLIDTKQNGIELDSLWKVIYSKKITKLIHASHQDLEIFVHLTGKVPPNVFDTQTAALFAGLNDNIGYQTLINRFLDRDIDKSEQYTDWAKRPLTQKQLNYAAADVAYLIEVYDKLCGMLKNLDRLDWFNEEMHTYLTLDKFAVDPRLAWKRLRLAPWKSMHQPMLEGLAKWREETARSKNIAKSLIVKDIELGKIAKVSCAPEIFPEEFISIWTKLEKLGLADSFLSEYIVTLESAKHNSVYRLEEPLAQLSQQQLKHYEFLKMILSALSKELQLPTWVLVEKQELERYVRKFSNSPNNFPHKGWRAKVVWQIMLEASQGEVGFGLKDGEPILIRKTL